MGCRRGYPALNTPFGKKFPAPIQIFLRHFRHSGTSPPLGGCFHVYSPDSLTLNAKASEAPDHAIAGLHLHHISGIVTTPGIPPRCRIFKDSRGFELPLDKGGQSEKFPLL